MSRPKIRVAVLEEARPIIDFLAARRHDIGSVNATLLDASAPADLRLLCVAVADWAEVAALAERMREELPEAAKPLVTRVGFLPLPLDAVAVVFLNIVTVEA